MQTDEWHPLHLGKMTITICFFNLIVFVEVQARNFFILGYEGYDLQKPCTDKLKEVQCMR
jgi:hypothetical protein